ncbi:hypothetical protein FsymDg_3415 [Candidatus Protofrankia datiscae]|uniref:Carbamoyltransferase Kae1-like domain-containing protein n=1 Tax=Candidatus Protofrankia datiscae TaxID=2716812 RepID=F8B0R9_9ACTN|nr:MULTISPECIES: hypothetical protein [Protofrankia]AEH10709.1 hypothetical protein FsymDg_3415 [Candidatus Protofrankia datiscae]
MLAAAADVLAGVCAAVAAVIAARFHRAVADAVVSTAAALRVRNGLGEVALSGGMFLNAVLTGLCRILEGIRHPDHDQRNFVVLYAFRPRQRTNDKIAPIFFGNRRPSMMLAISWQREPASSSKAASDGGWLSAVLGRVAVPVTSAWWEAPQGISPLVSVAVSSRHVPGG